MHFSRNFVAFVFIFCFGAFLVAAQQEIGLSNIDLSHLPDVNEILNTAKSQKVPLSYGNNYGKYCNRVGDSSDAESTWNACERDLLGHGVEDVRVQEIAALRMCAYGTTSAPRGVNGCAWLGRMLELEGKPELALSVYLQAPNCHIKFMTIDQDMACPQAAALLLRATGNVRAEAIVVKALCNVYGEPDQLAAQWIPDELRKTPERFQFFFCSRWNELGGSVDITAARQKFIELSSTLQTAYEDQAAEENATNDEARAEKVQQRDARMAALTQLSQQISQNGSLIQQTSVQQGAPQTIPQNEQVKGDSSGNTACHNMTRCVQVVSSLFEKGANQTSGFLHIVVRNNCSQPIRITASVYAQNQSCVLSQTNNFDPGVQEDLGQNSDQSRYFVQADDNVTSGRLGSGCALVVANSCHP